MGGNPILNFILALALIVGGIIAAYVAYNSANGDSTAQNTSQYVNLIFSNVTNDFANNPDNFVGFDNTTAITAGVPPSSWVPSGSTTVIQDPWGGAVTFAATSFNGGVNNGYTLDMQNVPASICSQIGSITTPQTVDIAVNGKVIDSNPAYLNAVGNWPPAQADMQAACTSKLNEVNWTESGQ